MSSKPIELIFLCKHGKPYFQKVRKPIEFNWKPENDQVPSSRMSSKTNGKLTILENTKPLNSENIETQLYSIGNRKRSGTIIQMSNKTNGKLTFSVNIKPEIVKSKKTNGM